MKLIASRAIDGVGHGPAGGSHPGIVEQDDLAVAGERVADGWVVVIQGAHEVLEEHQRKTFGHPGTAVRRDPETAVREAYSASLNVLGKGHVLGELGHDASVPAGRV
jgi:hypothetical protein